MARSKEYSPAFHFRGIPVYWTQVLIGIHALCYIAGAIFSGIAWQEPFLLTPLTSEVFHQPWRLFTYPYFSLNEHVGPLGIISYLVLTFLTYRNGMAIEDFMGRTELLKLYASLIIFPGLFLALLTNYYPINESGSWIIVLGSMVACATMFPDAKITYYFESTYANLALVVLFLCTVECMAVHDIITGVTVWTCAGTAFTCMRLGGAGRGLDWLFDGYPLNASFRQSRQTPVKARTQSQKVQAELDRVLEKVSERGLASLSPKERDILERASSELRRRDQRR